MVKYDLEERKERARQLHKQGYNCSQCVFMVFDDIHGLPCEVAAQVAVGFGGGVGGQRQVCGAVAAMAMLNGFIGYKGPHDKPALYADVQVDSNEFKSINGSIICGELLKPGRKPCMELIEDAITIIDRKIEQKR